MAEFSFNVHESKLAYATVLKCYDLIKEAQSKKNNVLSKFFPNVSSQWNDIKLVVKICIVNRTAWSGLSFSKSTSVPDNTVVPPSAEVTPTTASLMYKKCQDLGITLSNEFDFEYQIGNSAMQTWQEIAKSYLEIVSLLNDLTLHKSVLAELDGTNAGISREPGQLVLYQNCDVPLADGNYWVESFYWYGIRKAFGSFYIDLMIKSTEQLFLGTLPTIETKKWEISATKAVDPDDNEKTRYTFQIPTADYNDGFRLVGALLAVTPSLDSPSHFYTNVSSSPASGSVTYSSARTGFLRTSNDPTDPDTPNAEFLILGAKVS